MLVSLKLSPEYQALDGRLAYPEPADAWQEDGLHFFAFELRSPESGANGQPSLAVFAMQPEEHTPVSAVIVASGMHGEEAQITNLRAFDYTDSVSGSS